MSLIKVAGAKWREVAKRILNKGISNPGELKFVTQMGHNLASTRGFGKVEHMQEALANRASSLKKISLAQHHIKLKNQTSDRINSGLQLNKAKSHKISNAIKNLDDRIQPSLPITERKGYWNGVLKPTYKEGK